MIDLTHLKISFIKIGYVMKKKLVYFVRALYSIEYTFFICLDL